MTESKSGRACVEGLVALFGAVLLVWAAAADDVWFQVHMMASYCVADSGALPKAHAARWIVAIIGLLLVFVVRPRLGRRVAGRSVRSLGSALAPSLRIFAAVVLALVVVELVLRVRGVRPPSASVRPRDVDLPPSASREGVVAGRTVHYATNTSGFRARTTADEPDFAAPTILFIGESIVFGYGLDYDETIPALVGAHTGIQTVNLAMSGSGSDEALLRLRSRLPRFSRPVAVVSFIVYSRLERNVESDRARLALTRSGALEEIPQGSTLLRRSPLWAVLRAAVPYHDDEVVDLTRAIMRETAETARARGAYPLLVLTSRGTRCLTTGSQRPWIAQRLSENQPLSSIDVDIDPSLALGVDIHPNPRGAEHYAAEIERALREAGVVH